MSSFHGGGDHFARRPEDSPADSTPTACPACQSPSISTTAKSPDANSYWRCGRCGEVWNVSRRNAGRYGGRPWR